MESEIPPSLKYFITDVARPSTGIKESVDYATEEGGESIIDKIDLMVETNKIGVVMREVPLFQEEAGFTNSELRDNEIKEEEVTDLNDLINYYGE